MRNPRFPQNALTTSGRKATKRNLRVVLYDRNGRGNLKLHDEGGSAHGRGAMAIPVSTIGARRTGKGVPKGMQPRNLSNSFSVTGKTGNPVVYQRTGKYQKAGKPTKAGKRTPGHDNRHLRLAYVTKPSNPVRADVPFHRDFERVMRREMPKQLKAAMRKAVATAFAQAK